MSTNLECEFIERQPGVWFYLLEQDFEDNGGNWRENADAYGPFSNLDTASQHLRDNHANPGAYNIIDYANHSARTERDYLARTLDNAIKPEDDQTFVFR